MLTTVLPCRFHYDPGADHYKTAASEAWGNLLDHSAPAGPVAAYQHNQTDLEFYAPNSVWWAMPTGSA